MDNRGKIIACALSLFSQHGYDAVGVQEIAEAAEITKPTLYHYFGCKRGLLNVLLQEHFAILLAQVEQAAIYEHDLPLTLHRMAIAYFKYAREYNTFYRMQLAIWFAPPDSEAFLAVSPYNKKQQKLLETLFQFAAEDHGNMKGRHSAYAATFLGMINTYIGMALNGYTQLNDELAYRAVHQFMHGIYS